MRCGKRSHYSRRPANYCPDDSPDLANLLSNEAGALQSQAELGIDAQANFEKRAGFEKATAYVIQADGLFGDDDFGRAAAC